MFLTIQDIDLLSEVLECELDLTLNGTDSGKRDESEFNYNKWPYNADSLWKTDPDMTRGEYSKKASKVLIKLWQLQKEVNEIKKHAPEQRYMQVGLDCIGEDLYK